MSFILGSEYFMSADGTKFVVAGKSANLEDLSAALGGVMMGTVSLFMMLPFLEAYGKAKVAMSNLLEVYVLCDILEVLKSSKIIRISIGKTLKKR